MNCGRIVHSPSTTRRTRVAPSPHGPSTRACRAVSPSEPTMEPSTEHRPNCGHKPPTWCGPTTVVARPLLTSTSPSTMKRQSSPIQRPKLREPRTSPSVHTSDQPRVVAPSPRGRYLPILALRSTSTQTTATSAEHRASSCLEPNTRFGTTTRVDHPLPTST